MNFVLLKQVLAVSWPKAVMYGWCLMVLGVFDCQAQTDSTINEPSFSLGFTMGANEIRYTSSGNSNPGHVVGYQFQNGKPMLGINLGLLAHVRLHPKLRLRFMPIMSLIGNHVQLIPIRPNTAPFQLPNDKLKASFLHLPSLLQWRFVKRRNVAWWIQVGPEAAFYISKAPKGYVPDVQFKKFDIGVWVGAGLNIIGDKFNLAPEIRVQHGFTNALRFYDNGVRVSVPNLFAQMWSLNLTFE